MAGTKTARKGRPATKHSETATAAPTPKATRAPANRTGATKGKGKQKR